MSYDAIQTHSSAVVWVNLSWSLGGVSNFCSNQTKCVETIYEKASHKGLLVGYECFSHVIKSLQGQKNIKN